MTSTERMDRLMTLLDQLQGGVNKAGSGIDFAALGISGAVSGCEQAVGMLDAPRPSLSVRPRPCASSPVASSGRSVEVVDRREADPLLPTIRRSRRSISMRS